MLVAGGHAGVGMGVGVGGAECEDVKFNRRDLEREGSGESHLEITLLATRERADGQRTSY